MLRDSLDAIRGLLNTSFPEVTRVYVNSVPDGFVRPSFYCELVSSPDTHLNKVMYQKRITWQIVYFAPVNDAGNPDVFNQLDVAETLKKKLMDNMVVTGPDGTVYHILDIDGGPRDAEVYITVRLEAEHRRPEPQYDTVTDIQHEIKEG